jgi:hypothetical protein
LTRSATAGSEGLRERVTNGAIGVGSVDEARPSLDDEPLFERGQHPNRVEDVEARGKERFPEMKPGMPVPLEDDHATAA